MHDMAVFYPLIEFCLGDPQALFCLKINMNSPKVTQAGSICSVCWSV